MNNEATVALYDAELRSWLRICKLMANSHNTKHCPRIFKENYGLEFIQIIDIIQTIWQTLCSEKLLVSRVFSLFVQLMMMMLTSCATCRCPLARKMDGCIMRRAAISSCPSPASYEIVNSCWSCIDLTQTALYARRSAPVDSRNVLYCVALPVYVSKTTSQHWAQVLYTKPFP